VTADADALQNAVQAARLLGRWVAVAQRHGGGCSCCPGLGDVSMEEVERYLLGTLRNKHAVLEREESLNAFLRECVSRRDDPPAPPGELGAMLKDVEAAVAELEKIQFGML
jgi:hypothetical protein